MMEKQNEHVDQVEIINMQIKDALKTIEAITERQITIKDAQDLDALEKSIANATDKLAGLITAKKIQQNLDSKEIKEQSKQLIKTIPKKMKNQGPREVEITTSRGEPIRVMTTYYSAKKKMRLLKKKKR